MKIAFVGTGYPMRGGMAQFNASLAREFARHHDVAFFSFTRQYPGLLFPGKTQYVTSPEEAAAVRFDAQATLDSIGPWTWWRTARLIAAGGPDLMVLTYWMPFFAPVFGTVARLVRRRCNAHIHLLCHNIIPHERRIFDLALTRYMLAPVDSFLVMSEAVRRDLLEIRPEAACRLVPHPIYDIFGEPVAKQAARAELGLDDGPWILFFGFIRAYKGLDLLLEALSRARRKRPIKLLVAGEFYEGEDRYRAQVERLGLGDAVLFHDQYIPENRVALYFSACDVVVQPYRSATQSGIVQVAYQLGSPIICTDVGGLSEVVPHETAGFVVPPGDIEGMAQAILRFYDEEWEARLRVGVSRERTKYTWAAVAGAIEGLCRQERA